jgi:hypothetical protein
MDPLYWVLWSAFCAIAAGVLVFFVMQSRMDVVLAKQREILAEARTSVAAQREAMDNTLKTMEETTRRKAMDDFLSDIRIEERHYTREHKMLFLTRKCMVMQERIFFRNIPLTSWVERELPLEEGADMDKLARTMSIFTPDLLLGSAPAPGRKVVR